MSVIPSPSDPTVLSQDEVAAYLRTSVKTIQRACNRGDFPHLRVGRQIRFRIDHVLCFLDAHLVEASAAPHASDFQPVTVFELASGALPALLSEQEFSEKLGVSTRTTARFRQRLELGHVSGCCGIKLLQAHLAAFYGAGPLIVRRPTESPRLAAAAVAEPELLKPDQILDVLTERRFGRRIVQRA